jgi:hypothetical protein
MGKELPTKVVLGKKAGFNVNYIFKSCKESRQISSFQKVLFSIK